MVTVIYRADTDQQELAGRMVNEVRAIYQSKFNFPAEAIALVNGTEVGEAHVLKDGDKLEFRTKVNKA